MNTLHSSIGSTLRWVECRSRPAAAMYVLPIVLIFSTPLYFGFDNNWTRQSTKHLSSHIDVHTLHTHAAAHIITVWPWPLTSWPQHQYMPRSCHRVGLYELYEYQVWCWYSSSVFLLQRGHVHTGVVLKINLRGAVSTRPFPSPKLCHEWRHDKQSESNKNWAQSKVDNDRKRRRRALFD